MQLAPELRKGSVQASKSYIKTQVEGKLTPLELLHMPHNLKPYEKEELMSYGEIYYWGQNCL